MREGLATVTMLLISLSFCVSGARSQQTSAGGPAEKEVRDALCEIEQGDFAAAEKRLDRLLRSDPGNVYARRLLPVVISNQVKPQDRSPGNIALARRAVAANQRALNDPQVPAKERAAIENQILALYATISREEESNELLRRASDSSRTPTKRAESYARLAQISWGCSNAITESPDNRVITMKGDRAVVAYKMPKNAKEFQAAKACVERGMEEVEGAIKFDQDSEAALGVKSLLLIEAARLAEMENNQAQKAAYQREAQEAQKRSREIGERLRKELEERREKEEGARAEKEKQEEVSALERAAQELTEYEAETPLYEAIEEFYSRPLPIQSVPLVSTTEEREVVRQDARPSCLEAKDGSAQLLSKREWKSFTPAGEDLTVELPDNVCYDGLRYIAASEGVKYSILPQPHRPDISDPVNVDRALNIMAHLFVGYLRTTFKGVENSLNVKLLRRETLDGRTAKVYAYTHTSCSGPRDGVFVVYAGRTNFYTVHIDGASESDQRAQRFLKSVRFK